METQTTTMTTTNHYRQQRRIAERGVGHRHILTTRMTLPQPPPMARTRTRTRGQLCCPAVMYPIRGCVPEDHPPPLLPRNRAQHVNRRMCCVHEVDGRGKVTVFCAKLSRDGYGVYL